MTPKIASLPNSIVEPFCRFMHRDSVAPLANHDEFSRRAELISEVHTRLNAGEFPFQLHGYVRAPKAGITERKLPVFCAFATIAAFQLASALQEQIEKFCRKPGRKPRKPVKSASSGSLPLVYPGFSRKKRMEEWRIYDRTVRDQHAEAPTASFFTMLDIADFFPSIELDRLRNLLYEACPRDEWAINALFYHLHHWKNVETGFRPLTKGIPMDLVGDGSQLLASLFLADLDRDMRDRVDERFGRFVDDMYLVSPTINDRDQELRHISERLDSIGLKLSDPKTLTLSHADFGRYWGIDIIECFESTRYDDGLNILRQRIGDPKFGRADTFLRWALYPASVGLCSDKWRGWLRSMIHSRGLIHGLDSIQLVRLFQLHNTPQAAVAEMAEALGSRPATKGRLEFLRALAHLVQKKKLEVGVATQAASKLAVDADRVWRRSADHFALDIKAA